MSFVAAFLLAASASTAGAQTLRGGPAAPTGPRVVRAARNGADTFRPLAPGEVRFLDPTSAPFAANASAAGVTEEPRVSGLALRTVSVSTARAAEDPWTDTVVVASARPDSSRLDAILTGAVVRIALEHP